MCQVHGDVFRAPKYLELFSALIGTGCQLAFVVLSFILFAIAGPIHGDVHEERGETISFVIIACVLTSVIAGISSGNFYQQFFNNPRTEQQSKWEKAMVYTVMILL